MRLSCYAYSYRQALQAGNMTLPEFIQVCRKTGFDGGELTAYYFASTERPYLNDLKRLAHREGMLISGTAIGSDFAHSDADKLSVAFLKRDSIAKISCNFFYWFVSASPLSWIVTTG